MTTTPTDITLYNKVRANILLKYKTNSAYRSGLIVKEYKREFFIKHKNNNSYNGDRDKSNLRRWYKEKWTNQRGEVGYSKKGDIYRPSIIINNKTPITFGELSSIQIKKAMKEKKVKGRVNKF